MIRILLLVILISSFTFGQENSQKKNDKLPEVFGADVLSGGEVFRGSFAQDGRTFYFFKKITSAEEDYRIFSSQLTNGKWSSPQQITLGGEYSDLYPSISKDGRRMVFVSYRPAPGDTSTKRNAYLWYVDKKGNEWGEPVFITSVNKFGHYHSWAEIGFDGNLYFRQTTPDWRGNQTFVSRWNGKEYTAPLLVEEVERWKNWKSDVRIAGGSFSPDGKVVFLDTAARNPKTGKGASDIWVSFKTGNQWSEPKPLGADINSDGYDNFHFFSPNGKELYFVRDFNTFYKIKLKTALNSVKSSTKHSQNR